VVFVLDEIANLSAILLIKSIHDCRIILCFYRGIRILGPILVVLSNLLRRQAVVVYGKAVQVAVPGIFSLMRISKNQLSNNVIQSKDGRL